MKQICLLGLVFWGLVFFAPISKAWDSPVQDQLKASIDQIIEVLKDPSLKGEENTVRRREALRSIIDKRFSFAAMSQRTLAKHWKQRSAEEKAQFVQLFGKLLENTYVSKIESYTNEKVEYVKELMNGTKGTIYTKIVTESIEIPIEYRMYKTDGDQWMVYDLVIEGVSLVANYRSQFDQILQKDSYEKLVADLKKKVEN